VSLQQKQIASTIGRGMSSSGGILLWQPLRRWYAWLLRSGSGVCVRQQRAAAAAGMRVCFKWGSIRILTYCWLQKVRLVTREVASRSQLEKKYIRRLTLFNSIKLHLIYMYTHLLYIYTEKL
jgi:hypothetical protein